MSAIPAVPARGTDWLAYGAAIDKNLRPVGVHPLDSFDGADDEAKLTAALSYAGAQTYVPPISLSNRLHTFTTTRASFEGLSIIGPPRSSNAEKSTQSNACRISLSGLTDNTGWIDTGITSGERFNVNLHNLSFTGAGTEAVLSSGGTSQFYCAHLSGITTSGARLSAGKVLMTASLINGWIELNNHTNTTFTPGGSDNTFFPDGGLIDSPGASSPANGTPHLFMDYCEKSTVGPIYMTAAGNWSGIRQDGPDYNTVASNLGGPNFYTGLRLEGRNASDGTNNRCNGSLVKVNGGAAVFTDCWTSYAMGGPLPTGHDGVIDVSSGAYVQVKGCHYDKATSVAETVPYVHVGDAGSQAVVAFVLRGGKGGAFTGLPVVTNATGTATNVRHDSSVQAATGGTTAGL